MILGFLVGILLIMILFCFDNIILFKPRVTLFNSILSFLLLFFVLGLATYNNDWIAYEEMYYGHKPTFDLFYSVLFNVFNSFGVYYKNFYLINEIVLFVLLLFYISRFSKSYSLVVCIVLILVSGASFSILMRYSMSFVFYLISSYFFLIRRNRIIGFVFAFFSVISHFGIFVLMFVLVQFIYKNISNCKFILIVSFSILFASKLLFGILVFLNIGSFSIYVNDQSSLLGGILAITPFIPWIVAVYLRNLHLLKVNNNIVSVDPLYNYLYKLSLFPILFIPISVFNQIAIGRYVEPFIIIWALYLVYSLKYSNRNKFILLLLIIVIVLLSSFFRYILPLMLIGFSEWTKHYLEILVSNRLLLNN